VGVVDEFAVVVLVIVEVDDIVVVVAVVVVIVEVDDIIVVVAVVVVIVEVDVVVLSGGGMNLCSAQAIQLSPRRRW
jgi:hypothetical protein